LTPIAPALSNGAVAAVQHVRNPISLARLVMERTPHSLIAGAGLSATGWDELIMKVVWCKAGCDYTLQGHDAQAAAEKAMGVMADRAQGLGGLMLIDRSGQIGVSFNTPRMARAWVENDQIVARIERDVSAARI
jgi:isoaspartyl peptidase/L-asparaginase-like protein (Ntn-hydrolase superfamily)